VLEVRQRPPPAGVCPEDLAQCRAVHPRCCQIQLSRSCGLVSTSRRVVKIISVCDQYPSPRTQSVGLGPFDPQSVLDGSTLSVTCRTASGLMSTHMPGSGRVAVTLRCHRRTFAPLGGVCCHCEPTRVSRCQEPVSGYVDKCLNLVPWCISIGIYDLLCNAGVDVSDSYRQQRSQRGPPR
jgi:hypothetical protein